MTVSHKLFYLQFGSTSDDTNVVPAASDSIEVWVSEES